MEIPGKVIFACLCGATVGYALARQLEGVHSKLLDLGPFLEGHELTDTHSKTCLSLGVCVLSTPPNRPKCRKIIDWVSAFNPLPKSEPKCGTVFDWVSVLFALL